jgi:phage terminase small subunit
VADSKLTPKQERFCQEYIIDLNGTQAAIRAGYSEKTARFVAAENLTKPNIQERLEQLQKKREKRTEVTQDMVVKELSLVAFGRIADVTRVREDGLIELDFTDATEDQKALIVGVDTKTRYISQGEDGEPIKEVECKIKAADKMKALELLGRHLGMFIDKSQVTVDVTLPQQTEEALDKIYGGEAS